MTREETEGKQISGYQEDQKMTGCEELSLRARNNTRNFQTRSTSTKAIRHPRIALRVFVIEQFSNDRLSKVITWLRLLRLAIGLKESRQFFNQWEDKPKPIALCTRDFSRASSELQVIARNCDWFMALLVPVVIGRSTYFGFSFSTVIWKTL